MHVWQEPRHDRDVGRSGRRPVSGGFQPAWFRAAAVVAAEVGVEAAVQLFGVMAAGGG